MSDTDLNVWRKCSACKKPILFNASYFVCSVSTCNGQRTGYVFCSVACWETHVPGARHRDAAAVEQRAPAREAALNHSHNVGQEAIRAPARMMASTSPGPFGKQQGVPPQASAAAPREVLIIASRLKEYIDARSDGFNTAQSVIDALSEHIRAVCDRGIENARADGRKTVMDRDFAFLKRS